MNPRTDWVELYTASTGRLARTPFLIAAAILIAVACLYESIAASPVRWLTGWIAYPVLLYAIACIVAKRMHDRGRSGWWAGLVVLAIIAVWPWPEGFVDFLFSLVLAWSVIELGVMGGEQGANRFGPNPLRPIQA